MKANILLALLFFCFEVRTETDLNDPSITAAKRACSQFPRIERKESSHERAKRTIGGDIVPSPEEFPWMAALFYADDYKLVFGCGGIVISEYYIMTAAHCVSDSHPPLIIRLGEVSLNDTYNEGIVASHYYVKNITRHPNYSMLTKTNDIALIRLTKKIRFSNTIRPACLHTDISDIDNSTKLIVIGWGYTIRNKLSSMSNNLRKIAINTVPLSECNAIFLNNTELSNLAPFRNGLSAGQYCAYDAVERKDACQGDAGGPLQLIPNNDLNEATIVGIASFGVSCGLGYPGIYTRVAYYKTWIESIVWPEN